MHGIAVAVSRDPHPTHMLKRSGSASSSLDPMVEGFTPFANLDGGYVLAEIR